MVASSPILAVTPQPPSTSLPPLKKLHTYSPAFLALSIRALTQLYHPSSSKTTTASSSSSSRVVDSGYASAPNPVNPKTGKGQVGLTKLSTPGQYEEETQEEDQAEDRWDQLRADTFEREWAMRWLLGFITRGEEWAAEEEDDLLREEKQQVLDSASTLLAACSRTSEAGTLRREYSFLTQDGGVVRLATRDEQYSGEDHTAVGVQTWASSTILAELFARDPSAFGFPFHLTSTDDQPSKFTPERPCRILELGAGTGVLSLLLATLAVEHNPEQIPVEIVATDYHPTVLSNLSSNLLSNFPALPPWVTLACDQLDWRVFAPSLEHPEGRTLEELLAQGELEAPFDRRFDIIVAADVIYEPAHVCWVYGAVKGLLAEEGVFHLIMPERITHEVETALARGLFRTSEESGEGKGKEVRVTEYRETERWAGRGRPDEVRYMIWQMGWV